MAHVEGRFYPAGRRSIFELIHSLETQERYPVPEAPDGKLLGAVLPHAGHIYSGHQCIPFFRMLASLDELPGTFVIVHPNHTGLGPPVAVDDSDLWVNTVGEVPVDRKQTGLPMDGLAHRREHSAEVIIPFLQYYLPSHSFSILPVCMRDQHHDTALEVSLALEKAQNETGRRIMILASCDFSHFLSPDEGRGRDQHVVDHILNRNPRGVEQAVHRYGASVCGYGPIMVLMHYSATLSSDYQFRILARGHSGEVHASPEVVHYISMISCA
jgi:AmmeMemoRadiSam system protein B